MKYEHIPTTRDKIKKGDLVGYQRTEDEIRYAIVDRVSLEDGQVWGTWCDTPELAISKKDHHYILHTMSDKLFIVRKRMSLTRFLEEYS